MSEIIERNKTYLVKSKHGTYPFNNKQSAEQLNKTLNNYEIIQKQQQQTVKTLDNITRKIIQLQMTAKILQDEIDQLKKEVYI